MNDRFDTMMEPRIEELLACAGSKFSLVALASMRARQINSYYGHLGDSYANIVPPQVTSTASKSLSIAFEEIAAGRSRRHQGLRAGGSRRSRGRRRCGNGGRARCSRRGRVRRRGLSGTTEATARDMGASSLAGKRIVLGVSGGIAAYKAIEVCRQLVDAGAHVAPVMTAGARSVRRGDDAVGPRLPAGADLVVERDRPRFPTPHWVRVQT